MKSEEYIICKTLLEAIDLVMISKKRLDKRDRIYYQERVNRIAEEIEYSVPSLDKNIEQAKDILIELSR